MAIFQSDCQSLILPPIFMKNEVFMRQHPLDDMRMDVSLVQTQRTMTKKRLRRTQTAEELIGANQASSSLRRYGRKMFNHALECEQSGATKKLSAWSLPETTGRESRYSEDGKTTRQASSARSYIHSGPTKFGSPLYNNRAKLMNEIRTRPKSEPIIFNHERSKTLLRPEIQQTIVRSNEEFRIVSPTQSSSGISYYRDVLLVPKLDSKNLLQDEHNESAQPQPETRNFESGLDTIMPMDSISNIGENQLAITTEDNMISSAPVPNIEDLDVPEPELEALRQSDINAPSQSVQPKVSLKAKAKPVSTPDNPTPASPQKVKPGLSRKDSVGSRMGSSQSRTPSRGSRADSPSKKKKSKKGEKSKDDTEEDNMSSDPEEEPRPTFWSWVDDASVSSDGLRKDAMDGNDPATDTLTQNVAQVKIEKPLEVQEEAYPAKAEKKEKPKKGGKKRSKSAEKARKEQELKEKLELEEKLRKEAEAEAERKRQEEELARQAAEAALQEELLKLQELQKETWTLPDYIVPISERKSKEVAIKEWLFKTSFTTASKTVPLL